MIEPMGRRMIEAYKEFGNPKPIDEDDNISSIFWMLENVIESE